MFHQAHRKAYFATFTSIREAATGGEAYFMPSALRRIYSSEAKPCIAFQDIPLYQTAKIHPLGLPLQDKGRRRIIWH